MKIEKLLKELSGFNVKFNVDLKHNVIVIQAEDLQEKDIKEIEKICKKYFKHIKINNIQKTTSDEEDIFNKLLKKITNLEKAINELKEQVINK